MANNKSADNAPSFGPFISAPQPVFYGASDVLRFCRQWAARLAEESFEHEIAAAQINASLGAFPVSGARGKALTVAEHITRSAAANERAIRHVERAYTTLLRLAPTDGSAS